MNTFYRFRLGDFNCASISDGDVNYPVSSFFKDMPMEQAQAILADFGLPTTHVYSPYTLLFVDTGRHKVLVDTGAGVVGQHIHDMFREHGVDNSDLEAGIALRNMPEAGIDPADIDTVIITHAHPDHIGGNLDANGSLTLPNAQFYVWQAEWDFWFSDERTAAVPPSFVDTARANLAPLRDRITFVEPGAEIVPGIRVIPTPGHTPGHIALSIISDGAELLHLSDAVVHPVHLKHQEILLPYDILPEQTLTTRRIISDRAATSHALIFAHHFAPFPNLGHIIRCPDGYEWQPIPTLN